MFRSTSSTPALFLVVVISVAATIFVQSSDAFQPPSPSIVARRSSFSVLNMSSGGTDEQAKLLEQARKLREEANAMEASMRAAAAEPEAPAASTSKAVSPAASSKSSTSDAVKEAMARAAVINNVANDGTFYDDEVDSAPLKDGISDSMKQRLMREASTGLDSNESQTNVILYISVVIAILVALGGSGILY